MNLPKGFTQGAMKALVQAQLSAAAMGRERIGTGHLLIGLYKSGDEVTRCILGDLPLEGIGDMLLTHHVVKGAGPPLAVKSLIHDTSPFRKNKTSTRDKTAHRPLKDGICPLPIQPAQDRQPRGTPGGPLSAARFPA